MFSYINITNSPFYSVCQCKYTEKVLILKTISPGVLRFQGLSFSSVLLLVPVIPESLHFEQAVVAERTPPTEVEVEERSVVLVILVTMGFRQSVDNSVRSGGDSGPDGAVSLDEFDADNTLVHLVSCNVGKQGVL